MKLVAGKEPLEEAYFNCTIAHLYGPDWDGLWDSDFEIDTYKLTVGFCTKYWPFSEYLELSWDQFIDGCFSVIGGKLRYEDQALTMDLEMLPSIEAAQTALKKIRKEYAMLDSRSDGKNAADAAIRAGRPVEEAYFDCVVEHFYGSDPHCEWELDFEIDDENTVVKFCTQYRLLGSKYLELSWDQFMDGSFSVIGGKLHYEGQPLTISKNMLPTIKAVQAELKEIRSRYRE